MRDRYYATRMTETQIMETARSIVTNELLVADLSRHEWQGSLALIFSMVEDRGGTIGLVLVPMAPHRNTFWVNNVAPACTFECRCVHVNDLPRLQAAVWAMEAVLNADRLPQKGTT